MWSCSLGLIDASQPGLACQRLILEIPHVYFKFAVGFHDRNLPQSSVDLQAPAIAAGKSLPAGGGMKKAVRLGMTKKGLVTKIVGQDLLYISAKSDGAKNEKSVGSGGFVF